MGTGIVANAALLLPHRSEALHDASRSASGRAPPRSWLGSSSRRVVRWREFAGARCSTPRWRRSTARRAMALMTVGAGSLLLGPAGGGRRRAVDRGHAAGPRRRRRGAVPDVHAPRAGARQRVRRLADAGRLADGVGRDGRRADRPDARRRGAAGPAARLLRDVRPQPAGRVRRDHVLWNQLLHHGVGPARLVPTLWIVLGPLGQSITAANLLGNVADLPGAHAFGRALRRAGPRASRCSGWRSPPRSRCARSARRGCRSASPGGASPSRSARSSPGPASSPATPARPRWAGSPSRCSPSSSARG